MYNVQWMTEFSNQTQFNKFLSAPKTMLLCYGMHLWVPWCGSEGILPLRIGAASTNLYIERGADWCGQGKNNSFFEGCGTSTCPYGIPYMDMDRICRWCTPETRVWFPAIFLLFRSFFFSRLLLIVHFHCFLPSITACFCINKLYWWLW